MRARNFGMKTFFVVAMALLASCSALRADATILHTFTGPPDGSFALGTPIIVGGSLYGTTQNGGVGNSVYGNGTLYRVGLDGSGYSILPTFAANELEGSRPRGALTESGGSLYGTAYGGGTSANGTIFKLNLDGSGFTVLRSMQYPGSPVGKLSISGDMMFGLNGGGNSSIFAHENRWNRLLHPP